MPRSAERSMRRRRRAPCVDQTVEQLESRLLMARTPGIDISHWQGAKSVAQLTQAYNAGKRFMFHKATEGTDYLDNEAAGNIANARTAGFLVGVYHFAHPDTNSAVTEANWMISAASQWMTTSYLRPVLDLEDGSSLSTTDLSNWVNTFCTTVQNAIGVDPIIYCNTNYATNEVNSTVNTHPLWIANWSTTTYGDPHTTGSPPDGVWTSWKFWQYSSTESVPGFSSAIDADVYNGDYLSLQQNFVIGTVPGVPSGPSPADNATNVNRYGLVLNWADSANASSYDVYLDGAFQANVAASQWTPPALTAGAHNWQVFAKNAAGTVAGALWDFTIAALPAPAVPSAPNHNGDIVNSHPVTLDWADSANATSYDIYLGSSGAPTATNLTSSQYGPISPLDGTRLWRVVAKNMDGSTSGPQWQYTMDKTPPTATYGGQTPTGGSSSMQFTVTYTDVTTGLDVATYDGNDVTITGPESFSALASYVSRVGNVVTYAVNSPGATWDASPVGTYTLALNANQVKDVAQNSAAAGTLTTFSAGVAVPPYAYISGTTLHIEFPAAVSLISIAADGADTTTDANGDLLLFANASFSDVVIHGTSGGDSIVLNTTLGKPITFDGDTGDDTLTLGAGVSHTFLSDIGAASSGLGIIVSATAAATFDSDQHLRDLTVAGSAMIAAGGGKVLALRDLDVTGSLNINDNAVIVNYDAQSPLGDWTGTAYDGITGMIAIGRAGGWNGNGIGSAHAASSAGLTIVAAAEASTTLGIPDGETTQLWNGEAVDSTAVLIKYTYSGDADLNGELDGDDYFWIDSSIAQSGVVYGFNVGDFDLDGDIDGDDYFVIDSCIAAATGNPL